MPSLDACAEYQVTENPNLDEAARTYFATLVILPCPIANLAGWPAAFRFEVGLKLVKTRITGWYDCRFESRTGGAAAVEANTRKRNYPMAIENIGYALTLKGVDLAGAKEEVMDALNLEGFVELSEIDVKETLKEQLGIEFRNYLIVGVWHPELAYEALGADPNAGLLLPYNILLQDRIGAEGVVVSMPSPALLAAKVGNHELESISRKTDGLMQKVVLALGGVITGKHPAGLEDVIPMHPKAYPGRHMKEKLDGRREEGYELP